MKKLPPLRAIRKYCLHCMGKNSNLVMNCTSPLCSVFPYRFGSKPEPNPTLVPLKAIRQACLDCVGGHEAEARKCTRKYIDGHICVLHPYRMGHNPALKGKGRTAEDMEGMRAMLNKPDAPTQCAKID